MQGNLNVTNRENNRVTQTTLHASIEQSKDIEKTQLATGLMLKEQKEYSQAFEAFKSSADNENNPQAQNEVGEMYYYGLGNVTNDDEKAVEYFRKSADQGNAAAQSNLGWMYQRGSGVQKSNSEAVAYYTLSAEQGNANAQNNLGWMYGTGCGVKRDDKKAAEYYQKAADQGDPAAQNNLGEMFQQGRGVEKSNVKAVEYYQLSANQGSDIAQKNLGMMYKQGQGVNQNILMAFELFQKAAKQGNLEAKKELLLLMKKRISMDDKAVKSRLQQIGQTPKPDIFAKKSSEEQWQEFDRVEVDGIDDDLLNFNHIDDNVL